MNTRFLLSSVLGACALASVSVFAASKPVAETAVICRETGRYVGWPTICRRANGELVVVFSGDRDGHVCPHGKVQAIRSSDGGRTWSKPETWQNGPLDDRDAGLVELADGTLVLNWFTSVAYAEYADPSLAKYKPLFDAIPSETVRKELGYWSARSTDGGKTWEPKVRLPAQLPHGVTVLKDGRLLYVGKRYWHETFKGTMSADENRNALLCVESTDAGRSWRTVSEIAVPAGRDVAAFNEPHTVELADGTLVCQIRYEKGGDPLAGAAQTESYDGGRTWTKLHPGTGGYPPHLLMLKDGRLLSVYGKRFGAGCGQNGEYALFSEDGGKSWKRDAETLLAACPDWDHGYPATAELPDGELLTVFYGKEKSDDRTTCLRLARWRPARPCRPEGLTVEYRTDPVGLDAAKPRLSWKMATALGAKNERQTAYRVLAASSAEALAADRGDLWDSGKVPGEQSLNVDWAGKALASSRRVFWKVKTWDAAGHESEWSLPAKWTQGLMEPWKAKWIGFKANPQPAFEKTFAVKKGLVRATLHVTGVGYYVAFLNGTRVGDKVLDPAPTSYDRRVLYSTYELEGRLREGENTLKAILGRGWYDVPVDKTWNFDEAPWRARPALIAQLELEYADGTRETVVTDGSWKTCANPVAYDSLREAEVVGEAGAKPTLGATAEVVSGPKGRLSAEAQPGSRITERMQATKIDRFGETWVVTFPENVAGWVRLKLRGQKKGDVVTIRYDERIEPDGRPAKARKIDIYGKVSAKENPLPGRGFQTDSYVCTGAAEETYEPQFNYNGFQYAVIEGVRGKVRFADIEAKVVRTDFAETGRFACSDETLNRLMAAADRSYKGNFANGFPTDCPHREKNGWTGDAAMASEFAQYLYENTAAYEKWLRDICDAMTPEGKIPGIVPAGVWGGVRGDWSYGPIWDSALLVIAWNLWVYRGDRRILDEVWPALVKNLAYTASRADKDNLVQHGLGDWVPVDKKHMPSLRYTSSAYYYLAQRIAARIAEIKGLKDEAARFAAGAEKTKKGIFRTMRSRDQLKYDNGRQTAQAIALSMRFMPELDVDVVGDAFVQSILDSGTRLDVGIAGAKHLFRALSSAGYDDLALELLLKRTGKSYADWMAAGSTTLWEDFDDGFSRNHVMYGDFAAWAHQYLAGVRASGFRSPERGPVKIGSWTFAAEVWENGTPAMPDPEEPAFKRFLIAPRTPKNLSFVRAETETPYGTVRSAWRRTEGKIRYDFTIPPNTTARVTLPGGDPNGKIYGSGDWTVTTDDPAGVTVEIDFTKPLGRPIRAVNGVNNGPCRVMGGGQPEFARAHIPYMRTHDTVGMWGGTHYVDVPNIFPNMDADPDDPKNYDFTFTDAYLKPFAEAGTEIYYRLGVTIENYNSIKPYTTHPPKDFAKWAAVCERIVAHYTRGWANGFKWNIRYWEIWNEPENAQMWLGTEEEFFELYRTVANRLKKAFPEIKVGGYGACGFYQSIAPLNTYAAQAVDAKADKWFPEFCKYVTDPKTKAPLDFFSWHMYVFGTNGAPQIVRAADFVRRTLDRHGLKDTESHFTEWNKTHGGHAAMKTAAGASFCAAAFCLIQQQTDIAVATYYDACPTRSYCGLFDMPGCNVTPCYEAFRAFGELYARGKAGTGQEAFSRVAGGGEVYACAALANDAKPGREAFIIVNASRTEARRLKLKVKGGPKFYSFDSIDRESNGLRHDGRIKSGDSVWLEPYSIVICTPDGAPENDWN